MSDIIYWLLCHSYFFQQLFVWSAAELFVCCSLFVSDDICACKYWLLWTGRASVLLQIAKAHKQLRCKWLWVLSEKPTVFSVDVKLSCCLIFICSSRFDCCDGFSFCWNVVSTDQTAAHKTTHTVSMSRQLLCVSALQANVKKVYMH